MIKKLKIRFIVLAMVSLTVLLSLIVAGMNIANYQKVVSDADTRLEVLGENAVRMLYSPGYGRKHGPFGLSGDYGDESDSNFSYFFDFDDMFDEGDGRILGRGGTGHPSMTRDEAEESRFFIVGLDSGGSVLQTNVERISSIDETSAADYAKKAFDSGNKTGFIDDFRFRADDESGVTIITFLDCGRTLESFYSFLKASVLMSLIGLAVVFFVMLYFAGRIVRPVAESYEKQKRFITDAGHEIKTPLAIIKANIDLMDMEIDSGVEGRTEGFDISGEAADSLRENLGDINDQVRRLTDLTNDLVYLSRMEEADNSLVMTELPLSDIAEETVSSFEALAAEKGKVILKQITPMLTVCGSSKELEKLMSILLENAVKYSAVPQQASSPGQQAADRDESEEAEPPVIHFDLRKEGKNAIIEVRNETERELTNEMLSHVFERFYRTDSSRNSAAGGHGIGLSMANAIVNVHGGKITARTSTGHDFIVTASLPLR